jgi:hypothetical protein
MERDAERIGEIEQEIAEGRELEGARPVKGRVSKNLSINFAIRLSPAEFEEFSEGAKARGMTLAELMRSSTRAALAGTFDAERASAVGEAKQKIREAAEALSKV